MSNEITSISTKVAPEGYLDTFLPFIQLPPELRCIIQEFAIRDCQRGAHFFSTSKRPSRSGRTTGHSHLDIEDIYGFELTAPKSQTEPNSVQDWFVGNPSAYVKDVALWTMCWESRDIIIKRYKQLDKHMGPSSGSTEVSQFVSCQFTRNKDKCQFKVSPAQDLFCIQIHHGRDPWYITPFYRLPGSSRVTKFTNTAIEYDTNWLKSWEPGFDEQCLENSPRGCFIRTLWAVAEGRMPAGCQFWIIDRNIQRRDKPRSTPIPSEDSEDDNADEQEKPKPLVFQGLDRRYVEVRGLEECNWDALTQNTVFHFLHWLQMRAGFNVHWMMRHRGRFERDKPRLQHRDLDEMVKVLCEEKL
ncbi:uncharacterized protein Triagg1_3356 [Trichoderma aggressivum f. europaeum]|uniref:Uncharacterized protein n=1 Tax=Trichoderma aggressivum f. europaeum TaxID=173218 RepID=A0AAE1M0R7_9HYPO|nr:hypothetical protein Triagg1_3356 [Trichoderma aggressivum f. europaeum]